MGCDIHAYLEVKKEDKWVYINDIDISRNYDLFARLANVRNYRGIEPISEPRGMPKHMSKDIFDHYEEYKMDYHSFSYLYLEEMIDCLSRVFNGGYSNKKYIIPKEGKIIKKINGTWVIQKEKARLVFFFDN